MAKKNNQDKESEQKDPKPLFGTSTASQSVGDVAFLLDQVVKLDKNSKETLKKISNLGTKYNTLAKDSKKNLDDSIEIKRTVDNTQNLMILGFKVLLVMVATMIVITATLVIAYFVQLLSSNNDLLDKVNSLQVQLDSIRRWY